MYLVYAPGGTRYRLSATVHISSSEHLNENGMEGEKEGGGMTELSSMAGEATAYQQGMQCMADEASPVACARACACKYSVLCLS
jgi:hypothetical protein